MYWQNYPAVYVKRLLRIAHLAIFFSDNERRHQCKLCGSQNDSTPEFDFFCHFPLVNQLCPPPRAHKSGISYGPLVGTPDAQSHPSAL